MTKKRSTFVKPINKRSVFWYVVPSSRFSRFRAAVAITLLLITAPTYQD